MVQFGVQFSTAMCEMGELRHAWAQAEALGFNDTFLPETAPATRNAHTPLQQNGVPGSLITDVGYTAGATLADTVDRLSEATLLRVGRTLEAWLERGAQFGER